VFIELVETLRCVREHDESWLVASIDELRDRSIRRGRLGCPVCGSEYSITDGVADFSGGERIPPQAAQTTMDASEIALRAGAFLALGDAGGTIVLGGEWARGAGELARVLDVRIIAVNAPQEVDESSAIALVKISDVIPLGARSCAGAALDAGFAAAAFLSAQKIVRPGGRIVGPQSAAAPTGLSILASDESWWVGESPPEITTLRRGNR
jgi:hypothetical protein